MLRSVVWLWFWWLAPPLPPPDRCHPISPRTHTTRYPARDLWARASNAWDQIRSLQSIQDQHRTLVVAHNAINQALLWTALGCDSTYFRKISWPNCAVLELQWRRGEARAERYRWVVPEASEFVSADDAARLLKGGKDDNRYTL